MTTRPYTVRAAKAGKKWRFEVASGNGAIVASSKVYETKGSAERAGDQFAGATFEFVKLPRENAR
jgi:uncharacterized protein YegP (UPF0339 family)